MTTLLKPDICIVGGGSAGLSLAAAAAAFGVPVVLVERAKMGGDCLNYGCVPSKALLAAARHAMQMRSGGMFGIAATEPAVDFAQVRAHIRGVIAAIEPNDSVERFTGLGVKVIQAEGRFADERTLLAGDVTIRARRFVIATGSSPRIPSIPGLDKIPFLTNETVFDLDACPRHLLVMGGGPVGVELGQAFRRLGAEVTIVESDRLLGREDPDLAQVVSARLAKEGVRVLQGASIAEVRPAASGGLVAQILKNGETEEIEASHLLVAVGRVPVTAGLQLEKAGIALREDGRIEVDRGLRTANRRIYAIGDVASGLQFTHVASYHAGLVLRPLLFRIPARVRTAILPRVTYTDPELASVGLTEAEAAAHGDIKVLRWHFSDNDRAQAERATEGFIKVIAGRGGRILGVGIVGAKAGEMIHLWALAMSRNMRLRDMLGYIPPYPTFGEAGKRAAIAYFIGATQKPLLRGLVRLLRYFG